MVTQLDIQFKKVHEEIEQACQRVARDPGSVRLITVTKTWPAEVLQAVVDSNHPDIGENRVQEIIEKVPKLSDNRTIHMIGHLQSNKVSKVVPLVDWIHSIDSEKLLSKVDHYCKVINRRVKVLVQVNTSNETAKSGCDPVDAPSLCEKASQCEYVDFRGLMTIGPWTTNLQAVRNSFKQLKSIGECCQHLVQGNFELSMGMSGDFAMAIEEGATMIRVGSRILGERY